MVLIIYLTQLHCLSIEHFMSSAVLSQGQMGRVGIDKQSAFNFAKPNFVSVLIKSSTWAYHALLE